MLEACLISILGSVSCGLLLLVGYCFLSPPHPSSNTASQCCTSSGVEGGPSYQVLQELLVKQQQVSPPSCCAILPPSLPLHGSVWAGIPAHMWSIPCSRGAVLCFACTRRERMPVIHVCVLSSVLCVLCSACLAL